MQAHQIKFATADENSEDPEANSESALEAELGMPLNTALSLLRDKDDSIRLKIPVTGELDNINVNISGVMRKAIVNTMQTAALSQFGPLLAISAFEKLKSMQDALKLKPALMVAGESELLKDPGDEQSKRMQQISSLLDKRPKIKLNICGVSTRADHMALGGRKVAEDQELIESLNDKDREALLKLADQRAEMAKDYFLPNNIDGKRLILCSPKIDAGDGLPRTEFSL